MAEITIRIPDKTLRIAAIVLGAVLMLWGSTALWSSGAFRPAYQLHIFVPDSQGLRAGSPVYLNGMPVGRVSSVEPASSAADPSRTIIVTLRIERQYQNRITADSTAHLVRIGLSGDYFVGIQRGVAASPVSPDGEIRFVAFKEPTLPDFLKLIEALGKRKDCQCDEKDSAENKPQANTNKPPAAP